MHPIPSRRSWLGLSDATRATIGYALLTIVMTWPLARGFARDVPADLGDALLNCWILAWDADHLLRALGGHVEALRGYWTANIYSPHPLTLAYSEHLTAQALQILPIYALTKNPLLCYNVLFFSTFVVSGLGMFLFTRELTGSRTAAFVAGLAYAFAPYRFGSLSHVQVLSSAWMPFVLFGLRRFFESGRSRPLGGAVLAWIAQNLSCGYYLLFFAPVVALYIAWEMVTRRSWKDYAICGRLAAAIAIVALATTPFVLPYVELRRLGFNPRSLAEVDRFSADVYSYLTADAGLRLWGRLVRGWPKPEGSLFPGFAVLGLAAYGLVDSWRAARPRHPRATVPARLLGWSLVASSLILVAVLFGWRLRTDVLGIPIRIISLRRLIVLVSCLVVAWLASSRQARRTMYAWLASPAGVLAVVTLCAVAMSLGPSVRARGRLLDDVALYGAFYHGVPGFDGLRVPARFGMIVALGLATLAGAGAACLERRGARPALLAFLGAAILIESAAVPIAMNGNDTSYRRSGLAPLPPRVAVGDGVADVYRFISRLPSEATIAEFPFGEVAFELRYVFYSTTHWRRLVNGYSGGGPAEYERLAEELGDALGDPDRAWQALVRSGATHAIVHEASFAGGRGRDISAWLHGHGAREIAAFDSDRVFDLHGLEPVRP